MTSRRGRAPVILPLLLVLLTPAVPALAAGRTKPATPRAEARTTASAPSVATCVHTVRAGDSISLIARRYGVARQSVIAGNQLAHPDSLSLGQRLTIPRCGQGRGGKGQTLEPAVVKADGVLLARVGPRRVPTQLYLGVPDPSVRSMDFTWPIEGSVASPFGRRRSGWHAGIDIKADAGTPILAASPGTVVDSGWAAA